eukprot:4447157-Prymnesium_polylepis.1
MGLPRCAAESPTRGPLPSAEPVDLTDRMPAAIDAISTAPETTTLEGCMPNMLFRRLVADPTVTRALLTLFQYNNWGD